MEQPLVSIIIPTYSRAHLIGETLDSVLAQTYKNWECIIVDDGSTDKTDEVLAGYVERDTRFQYHHRPADRPKGANACRNFGFEVSKGEFINWFDSDDLMMPEFIEKKVLAFNDSVHIVISKTLLVNKLEGNGNKEKRTNLSENLLEDFITLKISWYLPDPMYKRTFFLKNKELFDENLLKGQDRDFHIRILMENPLIKIIDQYVTKYRTTDQSISNDFSSKTMISLYLSENRRILRLCKMKLQPHTELFLLKQQLKKYPYIYKIRGVTISNFRLFIKLASFNLISAKWLTKYSLAAISYNLFGKGYLFLKG